tara:strand:+ start:51 stop:1598 length:1548 start_codon:yes stop_codon:yes gene_type:complete
MTSSKDAVNKVFDQLLGRSAGTEGQGYWGKQWEDTKAAAIASGKSAAQAEAAATASISRGVGSSSEAFEYVSGTSDKATTAYDSAAAGVPDWFEFQDENIAIDSGRPEDWATDLKQSNLQNYVDNQNYQYGMLQGNTVGTEGNEWWGYQKTQNIQSHLAQGKTFAEAERLADQSIQRDIKKNVGHINYEKYGSIGYGNPLSIVTQDGDRGNTQFTEEVYLNLHEDAIAQGILDKTGTKIATHYELDEEGHYKEDAEGNPIPILGDDGKAETATPFQWQMVEDAKAPGGYRITAVPFITGQHGPSIKGHDFIAKNYQKDDRVAGMGGGGHTFAIPTEYPVKNVDGSQFTGDNALAIEQWQNSPEGIQAIAAGNWTAKNKGMMDHDGDGILDYVPSNINHATHDSNLGLSLNEIKDINWGDGWRTRFTGTYDTATYGDTGGFTPIPKDKDDEYLRMYGGGGGNTNINIEQAVKSKTAADQKIRQDDRGQIAGQGKKGFQNKVKRTGQVRELGIPAVS